MYQGLMLAVAASVRGADSSSVKNQEETKSFQRQHSQNVPFGIKMVQAVQLPMGSSSQED